MSKHLDQHLNAYTGGNLYDFDNGILLNWYPKRILRHTQGKKSLLELGIGHGYTTTIFAEAFDRHLVLDGSPSVIRQFRQKYPECKAEITETYFEDFQTTERFDVIVMGFVLEHVADPQRILRHYRQFLSENGVIFVAVPNAEVMNRRLGHLAGLLDEMTTLSAHDQLLGHQRYYTMQSFTEDLHSCGYTVNWMEGIYLKPFTTAQMLTLQLDQSILQSLCELGVHYPELCCGMLAQVSASAVQ